MITKELTDWTLGANYPYVPVMTCAAETGQILGSDYMTRGVRFKGR